MAVWVAGLAAVGASILLAIITGLALLQLAMASSAKRMVVAYNTAIIGKVALATLASTYNFKYTVYQLFREEESPQILIILPCEKIVIMECAKNTKFKRVKSRFRFKLFGKLEHFGLPEQF